MPDIEYDLSQDEIDEFEQEVISFCEKMYEYETENEDVFDSYAHLPYEGNWDYYNNDKRCAEMLKEFFGITVPNEMVEEFGKACLEKIEWRFGHIYSGQDALGAFPVGEIEIHISHSELPKWFLDLDQEERREILETFNKIFDFYFPTHAFNLSHDLVAYRSTDVMVEYHISAGSLREAYNEVVRENA